MSFRKVMVMMLRPIRAVLFLCAYPVWAQNPAIVEYALPAPASGPSSITTGPDGNLWFTEYYSNKIGRITPNGVITEFPLPTPFPYAVAITAGPDGNLWATEELGNNIVKISTSGVITEYPVPTHNAEPYGIVAGPDGSLWFSERATGNLGRITPAGVITEFHSNYAFSNSITVGPDGNLWTTDINGAGKTSTAGISQLLPLALDADWMTTGPDGNLWFADGASVGYFAPNATSATAVFHYLPNPNERTWIIAPGPDGNLWFNEETGNNIGRVTAAGIVTEYPVPTNASTMGGITAGPDGNVWFTEAAGNKIGKIVLSNLSPAITGIVNSASYATGPVSPGEIVTINGSLLGPSQPVNLALDSSGKVATMLGGVTVSFNGFPAPLILVSQTQVNCVVPYEVAGADTIVVVVTFAGQTSNKITLKGAASSPGIFTLNGSGTGPGAILTTTGCPGGASQCINSSSNPAPQGSTIVFYVTGEGQTTPPGVTGAVISMNTSGGPLTPQPVSAPTVTVGGIAANVAFYGETPGVISGLLQINAMIPIGLPSGDLPLMVSMGGANSQGLVTVSVK